jgi:predicted mannosyl-3-phosphoglycerate phosphatase (HAD superfamily)
MLILDEFSKIAAIGIGDSQNDLSMISGVDAFFLIGKNSRKRVWQKVLEKAKCFASSE